MMVYSKETDNEWKMPIPRAFASSRSVKTASTVGSSAMAARQWLRSLSTIKVKEVPAYMKENMTRDKVKQGVKSWWDEYCDAYIRTSSIKPLVHVIGGVFLIAYVVAYPTEVKHYRHAEEERIRKLMEKMEQEQSGGGSGHH